MTEPRRPPRAPRNRIRGAFATRERPRDFAPGGGLSVVLLVLLSCWGPLSIAAVTVRLPVLEFVRRVETGSEFAAEEALVLDARIEAMAIVELGAVILTGAVFIAWYRRVYRNLLWFGADRLGESVGWASWSWVVPIAAWFVPYRVLRETWRGSDPDADLTATRGWRSGPAAPALRAWWLAWVAANLVSGLGSRIARSAGDGLDGVRWQVNVDVAGDLFTAVAAALAIVVVRDIDRRQARKAPIVRRAIADRNAAAAAEEDGAPAPGR